MTTTDDVRQRTLLELAAAVEAAAGVLERLAALRQLASAAAENTRASVAVARRDRASWAEIAACLGVSKQAAAKKYGAPNAIAAEGAAEPEGQAAHPKRLRPAGSRVSAEPAWEVRTRRGRTLLRIVRAK